MEKEISISQEIQSIQTESLGEMLKRMSVRADASQLEVAGVL